MLDKLVPYGSIPFFWTRSFNRSIGYVGYATSFDEVFITGNVSDYKFVAYYIKDNKVLAVAAMQNGNALLTV